MADNRRYGLVNQLDMEQILLEAQNRWLRPAEICEILRNYKKFRIAPEPANMPPNGSLFLFDRKVLRYFRKDGHNWRKKKDGKTVKEAHERLKAESIDVLHCYYAHGEENENFQRRSYWMLEEELSHIVLVHYREVKGNRTNFSRIKESGEAIPYSQETEEIVTNSEIDSSVSSSFHPNNYQFPSHTTDTTSLSSAQASEYEDAESAYNHQASSQYHSFLELQQPAKEKIDPGLSVPYYPVSFSNDHQGKLSAIPGMEYLSPTQEDRVADGNASGLTYDTQKQLEFASWEDVFENSTAGIQSLPFRPSLSSAGTDTIGIIPKQENEILGGLLRDNFGRKQEFGYLLQGQEAQDEWQTIDGYSSHISKWPMDQKLHSNSGYDVAKGLHEPEVNRPKLLDSFEPSCMYPKEQNNHSLQNELQIHLSNTEHGCFLKSDLESSLALDGKSNYSSILKHSLMDGSLAEEGLKKLDSFNRWMSKELGDVSELVQPSSSEAYWDTVESENAVDDSGVPSQLHLDTDMLCPSISQDQLFSIIDFSPTWAYARSENKVLITGRFLTSQQNVEKCKWSCMFGEVEVPAEVVADGVLRCRAPFHKAGRVPFYVSCSNRLACSEVREFEYRINHIPDENTADLSGGNTSDILLHMRFVKLLSLGSECLPNHVPSGAGDKSNLSNKISQLMKEDISEWDRMLQLTSEEDFSSEKVKEQLLQQLLKEKLHAWLLQKASEGGKGPNVLDQGGQGVLHFAAALGYDWAILPTIVTGVSVNFRDVNGWTALHWAAFCGRERTVASLISLGAAPGALTDPTPKHPSGRTPADLASASAHKGIAGYLAESALSAHLSSLDLKDKTVSDAVDGSGVKAVQAVTERTPTPFNDGDLPYGLSMKDSLAAVCNATLAAARIHQVFRVQSFQKKQLKAYGNDKFGMSDEHALSLIAVKTHKPGQLDEPVHAAAIRIQNKFRGWKGRKEFLIIRQRIVQIQAHVRGHQVRKNYRKIIWSVGILDKVILRWRRKGSGLRGFKPEALIEGPSTHGISSKEDDDDFLKEGRKQTEARLQKALARVKSMVQYPEARDQYRRLLNVVTEIQETKVVHDQVLNSSEETVDLDNDLIDLEALLDDDTFMFTAS